MSDEPFDTPVRPSDPRVLTEDEYRALEALIFGIQHRSVMAHHVLWAAREGEPLDADVLVAVDEFALENGRACDQLLERLNLHDPRLHHARQGGA